MFLCVSPTYRRTLRRYVSFFAGGPYSSSGQQPCTLLQRAGYSRDRECSTAEAAVSKSANHSVTQSLSHAITQSLSHSVTQSLLASHRKTARERTRVIRSLTCLEEEFFIENVLSQIHFIIEMMWWTGLTPWESEFPFPRSLMATFLLTGLHVLPAAAARLLDAQPQRG